MQKKNSKLESFLFRSLPEDKYERIRGYESCIVVSEKENKAFKYVVLGDEWLYLTENPPKTIHETVGLGDIISVELINDYPDFLMGDDKRNSQHLAITYWTSDPVKRLSFRKKKSPRSGSLSDLHGDRSNASTPLSYISSQDLLSEDHGYSSLSSSQFNRPDSRGSTSSVREIRKASISKKKKKGSNKLHTIQSETEETILKSLKEELEEDILEDLENQSELGDSMMNSRNMKSARSTRSTQSNKTKKNLRPLPQSPLPKTHAFETPANGRSASTMLNHNDDLPMKNGIPDDFDDESESTPTCFSCCSLSLGKTKVSPFCGADKSPPRTNKGRLFSASEVSQQAPSNVHIEITSVSNANQRRSSIHSSVTTLRGPTSRAETPVHDDIERRSVLSIASVSDFGGSMNRLSVHSMDMPGLLEKRRAIIHIYLLSKVSPMLMLIRSAWNNYLLASTLLMNSEVPETPRGSVTRVSHAHRYDNNHSHKEMSLSPSAKTLFENVMSHGNKPDDDQSDSPASDDDASPDSESDSDDDGKTPKVTNASVPTTKVNNASLIQTVQSHGKKLNSDQSDSLAPDVDASPDSELDSDEDGNTPKGYLCKCSHCKDQPRFPDKNRGKTDLLFQELKRDILRPDNDMERTYLLLNELRMATEKNFSLKRLFWKNSELFHFCVKTLQQYLPKSTAGVSNRTDELEFVTLLIEILCMMFHESEIIPERTQALKAERGRSVVGLLMVLTCTPDFQEKSSRDSKKVLLEFTRTSLATVFELFLMAKQANWGYSEGSFYNISWMVTTLEEIKETEKFVTRLINMVMESLSPSSEDRLEPDQAVLLYRQLFILETFLKYSPRIRTFICATYTEEFKYFVQPPVIMRKLSQNFPVYHTLLSLIEDVIKKVVPPDKSSKDK